MIFCFPSRGSIEIDISLKICSPTRKECNDLKEAELRPGQCLGQGEKLQSSVMHWSDYLWSEARGRNMNFQKPKHRLFRWNILYSCIMEDGCHCPLTCAESRQQSSLKSCLTSTSLSKLIPLNYYNFLLKCRRESHKVKWGSDWIVRMFMFCSHDIPGLRYVVTFIGLFCDEN